MIKSYFVLNHELGSKIENTATQKWKKVSEIVKSILIFMSSILQMKQLKEKKEG